MTKKNLLKTLPKDVHAMVHNMARFEKKLRDKGIDDLKAYFERDGPIPITVMNESSLLVIWRGLHVAMVQQEDPLLQEDLADKIGGLIYCFRKEKSANAFLKAAITTFAREWNKFNVFLVNKLLMFFRRVIRHAIFRVADQGWVHADQLTHVLEQNIIMPSDDKDMFPLSPKLHLATIIMEELAKASNEKLTEKIVMMFIAPYVKVMGLSRNPIYLNTVNVEVFQHLQRQSDAGIDSKADLLDHEFTLEDAQKMRLNQKQQRKERTALKKLRRREKHKLHMNDEDMENSGEDSECDEEDSDSGDEDIADEGSSDEEVEDEGQLNDSEEEAADSSDEEMEEEDELEQIDEEEEEEVSDEEYPLDPRAGNVDLLLPQLPLDYGKVAAMFFELMNNSELRFKNRRRIRHLYKQFQDVSEGVFTINQHPSLAPIPADESHHMDTIYENALETRTELNKELKRYRPKGNKAERKRKLFEHDQKMISKVSEIVKKDKRKLYDAVAQIQQRRMTASKLRMLKRLSKGTSVLRKKIDRNRLKDQAKELTKQQRGEKNLQRSQIRDSKLDVKIDNLTSKITKKQK